MNPAKKIPLILGISVQLLILFAYVHHQNRIVQLQYKKQELEQKREHLITTTTRLQNRLYRLHNLTSVEKKARKELGMQRMNTRKITKIDVS